MSSSAYRTLQAMLFLLPFAAGCAANFRDPSGGPAAETPIGQIIGRVHGGQNPVTGSHVYLYAAATTGYGGASQSLLNAYSTGNYPTNQDANGNYYVTTDATGSFGLTGEYTCTAGSQVYLLSIGGDSGGGLNSAIGLMGVLGQCPQGGSFATALPYLSINEVTTVAAAYALSGFAINATHVGDDEGVVTNNSALEAASGMSNAFANAGNLVDIASGTANTTTPAGNGTVQQAMINLLGNILAACVNSINDSQCTTLFTNAANGSTLPTDTATAAINIAHNPGANVAALYMLPSSKPPFSPSLNSSSPPSDFSLSIRYTGTDLTGGHLPAIDASGDVWVSNTSGNLTKLTGQGVVLSPAGGYTSCGTLGTSAMALDPSSNLWTANLVFESFGLDNFVAEFSPSGACSRVASGLPTNRTFTPTAMAIDASGDPWIVDNQHSLIYEFDKYGDLLSGSAGYSGGGMGSPIAIAIDTAGNAWVPNAGYGVAKFSSAGVPASSTAYTTQSTGVTAKAINIDSSGDIWIDYQTVGSQTADFSENLKSGTYYSGDAFACGVPGAFEFDGYGELIFACNASNLDAVYRGFLPTVQNAGFVATPFSYGLYGAIRSLSLDSAGNAWVTDGGVGIVQMVGISIPIVTPLSLALKDNKLGARP